ncbi:MAG TPA: SDR family oxidoreductase [Candidatus Dormibacteraeota bacterium]
MQLNGAVAIVTGGGTGIGRAVSVRLAQAGARAVYVNYSRSAEDAEATARELIDMGCEGVTHRCNVAVDAECVQMVEAAARRFGRVDVLVNNAGTTHHIPHKDLDSLTDQVWEDIIGVNLRGAFHCSRAAGPELKKTRGAIVNVASIAAWRASGSSIAYGVSKAGLVQLTRNLAIALAPEVRVNSVSPGLVATRWFRQKYGDEAADAQEQFMAQHTPLGQVATPDHVAQAVLGLLGMDLVTGENLIVDGGVHVAYGPAAPARKVD